MDMSNIQIKKLIDTANGVIDGYYKDRVLNKNEKAAAFIITLQRLKLTEMYDIISTAANFNDLLNRVKSNYLFSEPLKRELTQRLVQSFSSPVYAPPTNDELLDFLEGGYENE